MSRALRIMLLTLVILCLTSCQGNVAGCEEDEFSAGFERIGVLRSTDGGKSWDFLGNACFHAPELLPVDPSPLASGDGVALYFLDLLTLNQSAGSGRIIYRASSTDGLEFAQPEPAFQYGENITDPYVLWLSGGEFRMYLMHPVEPPGILSATSMDGLNFIHDKGNEIVGAVPGAVQLPDGRVRLFVAGDPQGITSLISDDGLIFWPEEGVRLPTEGIRSTDPHPIRLHGGDYLMVYAVHPEGTYDDAQASLAAQEIRIASSGDGFDWITNPVPIGNGSVPGIVETTDGTLYVYYVDASHRRNP